jgi:hypothetical protein
MQPQESALPVAVEQALVGGDLSRLPTEQRITYYNAVCASLGLNPLTKPFSYIQLNGKLVLYALKDCTEQLRNIHGISLTIPAREVMEGVYVVTARAVRHDGRQDESTGAVPIDNLKGEARANAMMKAETKAKRRVTLSICGLGMLDETEVETIPSARHEGYSREAQSAVAERKIQQLSAAPQEITVSPATVVELAESLNMDPEEPPKATKKKVGNISFDALKHISEMKKALNVETGGTDDLYYSVLQQAGYAKSNEIADADEGRKVYKMLKAALLSIRTNKANREEMEALAQQMGPEKFWAFAGSEGLDAEALEQLTGDALAAFLAKLREEA